MGRIDYFKKRDPIFARRYPEILALSEEQVENQSCPNYRCRGNVEYHCVYNSQHYSGCGDKDMAEEDFYKYD